MRGGARTLSFRVSWPPKLIMKGHCIRWPIKPVIDKGKIKSHPRNFTFIEFGCILLSNRKLHTYETWGHLVEGFLHLLSFTYLLVNMSLYIRFVLTWIRDIISANCSALTRCCTYVSYVVRHERSLLFQCIVSILWLLTVFRCGYVKCSTLCQEDGSWLIICAWYSWEMTLNVGLDVSFDNM
jgi:hypothetical protein